MYNENSRSAVSVKFLETLSGTKDVGQQSPSGEKKTTAPQLRCRVFPDLD